MNPPEVQSDSDPATTYFDPDGPDCSEQQFSASLDARVERPRFVVDAQEYCGEAPHLPPQRRDGMASSHADTGSADSVGTESPTLSTSREQSSKHGFVLGGNETSDEEHDWRDQVSAKVSSYRSRRPRKDRYPSLRLQFEAGTSGNRTTAEAASFVRETVGEPIPIENTPQQTRTPIFTDSTARVLEFPRTAPPVRTDELAEPMMDRPRIVEAPELLPPPPALGGILMEAVREPEPDRRPGLDMPLQSAALSRRALAAGVDALIVAVSVIAFRYVFFRITGATPPWRIDIELAGGLMATLWPAYQYALLVFCGTTPGLRAARLAVTRFDGTPASRNLRRWRVLASLLSCLSLGLGYAWCCLDEDQLSWHDRITKTHLAPV
jgi:uncharacterized RDD family membrane protein YckC